MNTIVKSPDKVVVCPKCHARNRVGAAADGTPRCGNCSTPLPWIVDTSDGDFDSVADRSTVPVLVDVWAPWCGPCRMVSPVLEQLAAELAGRLKLVKVNADEAPEVSRRFGVQAIPTLVLLHHGTVIDKMVGAAPARALRSWLTDRLPKDEEDGSRRNLPSGEDGRP